MDAYIVYAKTRSKLRPPIPHFARLLTYAANRRNPQHRIADKWLQLQPCDSDCMAVSCEYNTEYDTKRSWYTIPEYGVIDHHIEYHPMPGYPGWNSTEHVDRFAMQVSLPVDWSPLRYRLDSWLLTLSLNSKPMKT